MVLTAKEYGKVSQRNAVKRLVNFARGMEMLAPFMKEEYEYGFDIEQHNDSQEFWMITEKVPPQIAFHLNLMGWKMVDGNWSYFLD